MRLDGLRGMITKKGMSMGFRFRKSIKLFPGVKLNLSKSGISTTIGVRGASINVGKSGSRATVGLPGTGISYSTKLPDAHQLASAHPKAVASTLGNAPSTSTDIDKPPATNTPTSDSTSSWVIALVIIACSLLALVTYSLVAR